MQTADVSTTTTASFVEKKAAKIGSKQVKIVLPPSKTGGTVDEPPKPGGHTSKPEKEG